MSLNSASVSSRLCLCRAHTEFKYEIKIGRGVVHILPKGGVAITPKQLHITVFVPNYVMRTRVETKTPLYLSKRKLPIHGQEMLDAVCPRRRSRNETLSRERTTLFPLYVKRFHRYCILAICKSEPIYPCHNIKTTDRAKSTKAYSRDKAPKLLLQYEMTAI